MKIFNGSRVVVVGFVLLYLVLATVSFERIYGYFPDVQGYQYFEISVIDKIACIFIALLPAFFLPLDKSSPSSVVIWFVYFAQVASTIVVSGMQLGSKGHVPWVWIIFVSLSFSCVTFFTGIFRVRVKIFKFGKAFFISFVLFPLVFCIVYCWSFFGLILDVPSITEVYEVRENFVNVLTASGSALAGYVFVAGGFSIASVSLVIGVVGHKKNKILSTILILGSVGLSFLIYGASGFKSVAFMPIACLIALVIFKRVNKYGVTFSVIFPLVLAFIYFASYFEPIDLIFIHWYRRIFMLPGMNSNFVFFYMGDFGLSHLEAAPQIISDFFYHTDGSANSGIYGDGYAKFGYLGVLLNLNLLILFLVILDSVSFGVDKSISASLVVPISYAISNSSLTSIFLTYGAIYILLFLYVFSCHVVTKNKSMEVQ